MIPGGVHEKQCICCFYWAYSSSGTNSMCEGGDGFKYKQVFLRSAGAVQVANE